MSNQELSAWMTLGIVFVFCAISTLFIIRGEK